MESMRRQGGIQMLLNAEQEAQRIVSDARNLKMTRLKQAKQEAEKELTTYRSNLEAELEKKLSESSGSDVKRLLEEETEVKIKSLKESASKVQADVVGVLINYVTSAKF